MAKIGEFDLAKASEFQLQAIGAAAASELARRLEAKKGWIEEFVYIVGRRDDDFREFLSLDEALSYFREQVVQSTSRGWARQHARMFPVEVHFSWHLRRLDPQKGL